MAQTTIEWTGTRTPSGHVLPGYTFNPWRGCTKVSPACENCYAEALAKRNPKTLGVWGPDGTRVLGALDYWRQPLTWDRQARDAGVRRKVFCASLADVFEDWPGELRDTSGNVLWWSPKGGIVRAPVGDGESVATGWRKAALDDARTRLWWLIQATPHLDWLLLTKRPENVRRMFPWLAEHGEERWPNVWLGATVEDQRRADERIPHLVGIPAAVLFLSLEPLRGDLALRHGPDFSDGGHGGAWLGRDDGSSQRLRAVTWVIVGGESGPDRRTLDPAWVHRVHDQCRAARVPLFVKQGSGLHPGEQGELPDELWRVKEWPDAS